MKILLEGENVLAGPEKHSRPLTSYISLRKCLPSAPAPAAFCPQSLVTEHLPAGLSQSLPAVHVRSSPAHTAQ